MASSSRRPTGGNPSRDDKRPASMEETLETLRASDEYPSDEDIKEAEHLKNDLTTKHRQRKRELAAQFQSTSREDLRDEFKEAKSRSKKKLDEVKRRQSSSAPKEEAANEEATKAQSGRKASGSEPSETAPSKTEEEVQEPLTTTAKRRDRKLLAAQMREKMKSKQRDESEEEGDELGEGMSRTLRNQRNAPVSTRFDEDLDELHALRSRRAAKEVTWEELKSKAAFTDEEAYDFFTRDWEPDEIQTQATTKPPTTEAPPAAGEPAPPGEGDVEAGVGDDKQRLLWDETEDFKSPLDFVGYGGAKYIDPTDQVQHEEKLLYVPGAIEWAPEAKIEKQPRYIEEEGFYVGRPQVIAPRNMLRLENRLIMEGKKEWFGQDGRIDLLPDPLKEIPYRPLLWDDISNPKPDHLKTIFINSSKFEVGGEDGFVQSGLGDDVYQMDVDLHSLVFTHHHLMSTEHVIGQRLRQLYEEYQNIMEKDSIGYCQQRIEALKRGILFLEDQVRTFENSVDAGSTIESLQQRIQQYRSDIKNFRALRNRDEAQMRQVLLAVLQVWKKLKEQRRVSGINNTTLQLKIHRELTDQAADERLIQAEVAEELEETRAHHEENYRQQMKIYNEQIQEYDQWKAKRRQAKQRQTRREKQAARKGTSENPDEDEMLAMSREDYEKKERDQTQEQEDLRILAEPSKPRPSNQPQPFNEGEEREKIRAAVLKNRRQPGEPYIWVTLKETVAVTPDQQCPRNEQQRRAAVKNYKYFFSVYFNNKKLETTQPKELNSDFEVLFGKIYPIQIYQYPQQIKFQLYEKVGLGGPTLLGEVSLAAPNPQAVTGRVAVEMHEFVSRQKVTHHHTGVGSNVQLSLQTLGEGTTGVAQQQTNTRSAAEPTTNLPSAADSLSTVMTLFTRGYIRVSVAWSPDAEGMPMAPPIHGQETIFSQYGNYDAVAAIGAQDAGDLDKLSEWARRVQLDPNDPRNMHLMQLLNMDDNSEMNVKPLRLADYFRLDHLQEEFNFATEEEIKANLRFRLLQLRNEEVPEFRHMVIPISEKEVPDDIFREYEEKRQQLLRKEKLKGFEQRKALRQQYLESIRVEVSQKFQKALRRKTLKEVVIEEEIPNISGLAPALKRLGQMRRPLQTIRTERKKVPVQNLAQMYVEVLVTISAAHNVPLRQENNVKAVNPFVEVRFQNTVQRTTTADGPNPSWNTQLILPFVAPQNVSSMDAVKDVILITLFDEVMQDVEVEDRRTDADIQKRIEHRWLGNLIIPFSTVYANVKVEGRFKLNSPPTLMGYDYVAPTVENITDPLVSVSSKRSLIDVFVTLEPAILPPEPLKERFESNEDESLLLHAQAWMTDFNRKFPDRQCKYTVVDMRCKEVLLTRYLNPLAPPEDILALSEDKDQQKLFVARYVSMIPFVRDSVAFANVCDIWSPADQFIKMLAGDEDEHAVLLVCYFLTMFPPNCVYLCLGDAIPEGPTAYVLTMESEGGLNVRLWNSVTGECFSSNDFHCPLKSIGCLANMVNVWANIQKDSSPNLIQFEMSNAKLWSPLFTTKFPRPNLGTVQPEKLIYEITDSREISSLRFQIESVLRERFMRWRKGQLTKWNYEFLRDLQGVLENLEKHAGRAYPEMDKVYNKINERYSMYGFPINLPYMEMDSIVERVQAADIHANTAKNIEFALVVYVKGYSNSVLSIWIFLAALTYRRNR